MNPSFNQALSIAGIIWLAVAPDLAKAAATDARILTGRLKGAVQDGVVSFKGIPFAQPPVGALRWRAPQPARNWKAVYDARHYAHDCMQLPFASDAAPLGTSPLEDCLYANVWKPVQAKRNLPVLVWIYGGGFVNGGSSPPTYSGAALAKQGIMFVSFNYRLGRFGTFAHPALLKANADTGLLGDYGYMDQLAALKWVQKNIRALGGDPRKVTIIGESAGGASVHNLLTSSLARGLFRGAVIQSGGDGEPRGPKTLADAKAAASAFAAAKGIPGEDGAALARLRALPPEEIIDGLNLAGPGRSGPQTYTGPFADGRIAAPTFAAYSSGRFAHVPVMIGATSDDIGGPTGFMQKGAQDLAGLLSRQGVPTYHYRFAYVADSVRTASTTGAAHASDIPYFFNTVSTKYGERTTARDQGMASATSAFLVNFVKTGSPNGVGLPEWTKLGPSGTETMDFSDEGLPKPKE